MNINRDQVINLVQTLGKVGGGFLVKHGISASSPTYWILGALLAGISFYFSHTGNAAPGTNVPIGGILKMAMLGTLVGLLATGCTTAIGSGKIVSVTERGIGFIVAQSVANQTPEFKFGFFSSTVVLIPTSTNAVINTPRYANEFSFDQASPFSLGIGENLATGEVMTQKGSNLVSQAIIPK